MLNRAEDYLFVVPDSGALQGGAHPFSGDIYPRRSAARKKIPAYEDICFLSEACGELVSALRYFGGGGVSSFPFGASTYGSSVTSVPRPLYGAGSGRFGPDMADDSAIGILPNPGGGLFQYHLPGNRYNYLKKFVETIGTDLGRLFSDGMTKSPATGKTLDDLTGYPREDGGRGYLVSGQMSDTTKLFDVFYTLVTLAYSLYPVKATAKLPFTGSGKPDSFNTYPLAFAIKSGMSSPMTSFLRNMIYDYVQLASHGGFCYFPADADIGTATGGLRPLYVKSDFTLPLSAELMTTSADWDGQSYDEPETGDPTYSAGALSDVSDADLAAEEITVASLGQAQDPLNFQLAYAVLEGTLGCGIDQLTASVSGVIPSTDVTELALSKEVSNDMIAALWGIPGACTKIFIPYMEVRYLDGTDNFTGISGMRYTEYAGVGSGARTVSSDSGPVSTRPITTDEYPNVSYSKVIEASTQKSWTVIREDGAGEGEEELVVSGTSSWSEASADGVLASGPTDGRVVFIGGSTSSDFPTVRMMKALYDSGALQSVEGVVIATVTHRISKWREAHSAFPSNVYPSYHDVTECTEESGTYPIHFTLGNPTFDQTNNTITWTPNKTEMQIVSEALADFSQSTGSVFANSAMTGNDPLPDPTNDPRMPAVIEVTPSGAIHENETAGSTSRFTESISVTYGLPSISGGHFWFGGKRIELGFAMISPRTAVQS